LDKKGCGSAMEKEKLWFFLFRCTHLALSLDKKGCGSAMEKENLWLFLFRCAHLALSLPQNKTNSPQ